MTASSSLVPRFALLALVVAVAGCASDLFRGSRGDRSLEFVKVAGNRRHFILADSGARFIPWGFNYDHDGTNRLLETYWNEEWKTVESDFAEMKALGANTVRIHLQVSSFMKSQTTLRQESLDRLSRLVRLAEATRLYLDLTGLGCYDKTDVPKWYNDLNEADRWAVQARFWDAIAKRCRASPAVFCYDLMNEPVVNEDKQTREWTPGAFGDRYFVQRITLDLAGRTSQEVAKAWVQRMTAAIRKQDSRHLITVGAIPWALVWPNAKPLFYSTEVGRSLDFVSLHFYPKSGEVEKALTALAVYDVGKPIVIEEMFPLSCSLDELDQFIDGSRKLATGWIGFYWGKTVPEYENGQGSISERITLGWLHYFRRKTPDILGLAGQAAADGNSP